MELLITFTKSGAIVEKIDENNFSCTHTSGEQQIISYLKDKRGKWRLVMIDNFSEPVIYIQKNGKNYRAKENTIVRYFFRNCQDIYDKSVKRNKDISIREFLLKRFDEGIVEEYMNNIVNHYFEID